MRPALGTFVEIGIAPSKQSESAFGAAFRVIEEVHARLSFQDPTSELSCLNASAGEWVSLSPLALRVLRAARALTVASDGLFNCTVGGALVRRGVLPDHCAIRGGRANELIERGGASDIEIASNAARLLRPVRVTLDGIAKGYAVDRAVSALRACGVAFGWVNAGGDLRVFGDLALPVWRRGLHGELEQLGELRDASLATSSVRADVDPSFPGTIVGAASASGIWSVTARFAYLADALTKVAANAPSLHAAALVARLRGKIVMP